MSNTPERHPITQVLGDPEPFLHRILAELEATGIDVSRLMLDHVCYRVGTLARYEALKPQLAAIGRLLHEAMIGGRPIATYKLARPISFGERLIDVVELPAPKPGRSYDEGYEHVEFVLDQSFSDFMARYPFVDFDTDGAMKSHNPELRVGFGEIAAKFHLQSLEDVITDELAGST